jgi:hypothetical protein
VVSVTDPNGSYFGFLDLNRSFLFQVAPNCPQSSQWTQLHTHNFSENLAVPRNKPGSSRSVIWNSDHYTTEAVGWPYSPRFEVALGDVALWGRKAGGANALCWSAPALDHFRNICSNIPSFCVFIAAASKSQSRDNV